MGVKITESGNWQKTLDFLKKMDGDIFASLNKFGAAGVSALASATPVESGETAQSWSYEIVQRKGYYAIHWYNSHNEGGKPIAILLQYGHGTGTGGYVQGHDYIMPAIRPIFDQIDAEMRKVVKG